MVRFLKLRLHQTEIHVARIQVVSTCIRIQVARPALRDTCIWLHVSGVNAALGLRCGPLQFVAVISLTLLVWLIQSLAVAFHHAPEGVVISTSCELCVTDR